MPIHADIQAYNVAQSPGDKRICDALAKAIDRGLPNAEETNVIVDELIPLADLAERLTSGIQIRVDETHHGERGLEQLREILRAYPGSKKLKLRLDLATGEKVHLDSGRGVTITPELQQRVEALLGSGSIAMQSAPPKPKSNAPNNGNFRRRETART